MLTREHWLGLPVLLPDVESATEHVRRFFLWLTHRLGMCFKLICCNIFCIPHAKMSQRAEGTITLVALILVIVVLLRLSGGCVGQILSTTPVSRNVSAGTLVNFTCATPETELTAFALTATPHIDGSDTVVTHPNGGTQLTLSFIAPAQHSTVNIACIVVIEGTVRDQNIAVLMIQGSLAGVGNLASTTLDHCTLHFTWTAPYTLQGVPINYYTINITRNSDRAVLRSDTTNTTEHLYTVSSLGETLEVVVAAVNGAGTGNVSSTITQTPLLNDSRAINITTNRFEDLRNDSNWTYIIYIKERLKCKHAIKSIVVKACLNLSCVNSSETVFLLANNMTRVMSTYTNLQENKKYALLLHVLYNGGVVQRSHLVEISTFDVRNISVVPIVTQQCTNVTVTYVHGYEKPANCTVLFKPVTEGIPPQIRNVNGISECLSIREHSAYNIFAIDGDASLSDLNSAMYLANISINYTIPATATNATSESTIIVSVVLSQNIWIGTGVGISIIIILILILPMLLIAAALHWNQTTATSNHPQDMMIMTNIGAQTGDTGTTNNNNDTVSSSQFVNDSETESAHKEGCTTMYAEVIKRKDEQAVRPAAVACRVIYGDMISTANEQNCVENLRKMMALDLNHSTLFALLKPLSSLWYQLGEALTLMPHLNQIMTANYEDEQRLSTVLQKWEQYQIKPYSWETLVNALKSNQVRAMQLADELEAVLKAVCHKTESTSCH